MVMKKSSIGLFPPDPKIDISATSDLNPMLPRLSAKGVKPGD